MPKLYVANVSRQNVEFNYRMPGQNGVKMVPIHIGTQVVIHGELDTNEIDSILEQHVPYGLVAADTIRGDTPYVGLCYAIDKAVRVNQMLVAMDHNQEVLHDRGRQMRQQAAVATNSIIDKHLQEINSESTLQELEVTIEEERKPGTDDSSERIREGTTVNKNAPPPGKNAPPQSQGRKGR